MSEKLMVGGQAVIEGVMMRGPKKVATAVREPSGVITVDVKPINSLAEKYPIFKKPFFRGILSLGESLVMGLKSLTYSAQMAGEEEADKLTNKDIAITMVISLCAAILLFVVIPTASVNLITTDSHVVMNLWEGLVRMIVFFLYIYGISRAKDIQRVFQYHGAEHKTIHAYEAGVELIPENVQKFSRLHPRCGTSFLLIVMIVSIFMFSFLGWPSLWERIISRVLLLPVVAGISYELIRFAGRSKNKIVHAISLPGLWLQYLTTREPDDSMIEVAVKSLKAAIEVEETAKVETKNDDMRHMLEDEVKELSTRKEVLEGEFPILLLPKDPNDSKNVIMEIRGGVGGEEAALFAGDLFRMYSRYAEMQGWKVEMLDANPTELGGFKEVSFCINGYGAYSKLKYESGTHRVQRVPQTESSGRVHTSAVTVAVLPEVEDVEVDIKANELRIDTYCASGAGGQYVNRTETAVRITHIPTGIVVQCQDEKSQLKNKEKAMRVLRAKVQEQAQQAQNNEIAADRKSQVGSGDRSERIRTYNFPQGRVTDHRIGLTLHKLDFVLNGEIDEIINALITADQTERLKQVK